MKLDIALKKPTSTRKVTADVEAPRRLQPG
jgi:hypothetical protein